jgi:hypothetical protein
MVKWLSIQNAEIPRFLSSIFFVLGGGVLSQPQILVFSSDLFTNVKMRSVNIKENLQMSLSQTLEEVILVYGCLLPQGLLTLEVPTAAVTCIGQDF